MFKQYHSDKRWWRFVAGLTGLESFWHGAINEAFVTIQENKCESFFNACMKLKFLTLISQLLLEQTKVSASQVFAPLERYALGYCIAISTPTASWEVTLYEGSSFGASSRENDVKVL